MEHHPTNRCTTLAPAASPPCPTPFLTTAKRCWGRKSRIDTYTYLSIYLSIYIYMYICICICVFLCIYIYISPRFAEDDGEYLSISSSATFWSTGHGTAEEPRFPWWGDSDSGKIPWMNVVLWSGRRGAEIGGEIVLSEAYFTWWFIPLSKWVITPLITGISKVNPLATGVITHLVSGMNHQVLMLLVLDPITYLVWFSQNLAWWWQDDQG